MKVTEFGNGKLHDHILSKNLAPYLERILANDTSGEVYTLAKEVKIYRGRIVLNPDVIIQSDTKDLIFEVKSSRDENAWKGAIGQFKKCEKFYFEKDKNFNFYIVRPSESATKIQTPTDLEILLLYSSGNNLSLEKFI